MSFTVLGYKNYINFIKKWKKNIKIQRPRLLPVELWSSTKNFSKERLWNWVKWKKRRRENFQTLREHSKVQGDVKGRMVGRVFGKESFRTIKREIFTNI